MKLGIITNAVDWRSRKLQGKTTYQGLPVSIENERGSIRQGTSEDGHVWRTFMHMAYGYIRATEGTDGDHVDCYLGPNQFSDKVFVIHQQDPKTKAYDEDKVMLGYNNALEAKHAYCRQYDSPGFFQSMSVYDMATFKTMLKDRVGMKLKKSSELDPTFSKLKSKPVVYTAEQNKDRKALVAALNASGLLEGKNRYNLKELEGFPKGVDLENCDMIRLTSSVAYFEAGGDWQQGVIIGVGLKGGKLQVVSLYDGITAQPRRELAAALKIEKASKLAESLKHKGKYQVGKSTKKIRPSQLAMGIHTEMEHTDDKEVAKQIALDHLQEDPEYYTHLAEMESKNLEKAKKMPVGTVSKGRKKVAEGDWRDVPKGKAAVVGISSKDKKQIKTVAENIAEKTFDNNEHTVQPYDNKELMAAITLHEKKYGEEAKGILLQEYARRYNKLNGLLRSEGDSFRENRKAKTSESPSKSVSVKKGNQYVIWGVAPGKDYEDLVISDKVDLNDSNKEEVLKKLKALGVTKMRVVKLEPLTDASEVAGMFAAGVKGKPEAVKIKSKEVYQVTPIKDQEGMFSILDTDTGKTVKMYGQRGVDAFIDRLKEMKKAGFSDLQEYVKHKNTLYAERIKKEDDVKLMIEQKKEDNFNTTKTGLSVYVDMGKINKLSPMVRGRVINALRKQYNHNNKLMSLRDIIDSGEYSEFAEVQVPQVVFNRTKYNKMDNKQQVEYDKKMETMKVDYVLRRRDPKGYAITLSIPKLVYEVLEASKPKGIKKASDILYDLEKAKALPEGTRRVYGGRKVKKQGGKWVADTDGKQPAADEPDPKKRGAAAPDSTKRNKKDPEDVRGSKSGYGTHNIEVGDTLEFKGKDGDTIKGKVVAEGQKGASVDIGNNNIRKVEWNKVTGFSGEGKKTPVSSAPEGSSTEYVEPASFKADDWAAKMDDPAITKDSILDKAEEAVPGTRNRVDAAEARLAHIEQTIHKYRISGEGAGAVYDEDRTRLHEDIIRSVIPPEKFLAAKPAKGEKPVLIMLGGRGGSGKSWFKGQVYDPEKTVVLDADEIKGMLKEYEGWNAFQVHEESSDILEKVMSIAQSYGLNVVVDATMKTPRSAVGTAQRFLNSDYSLECHYMHCPRKIAAERALSRFMGKSGRYVPVDVILGNTKNEQSFEMVREMADSWSFRDSSGGPPPKLISGEGKGRFMEKSLRRKYLSELFKAMTEKPKAEPKDEKARENANSYDMYDFREPSDGDPFNGMPNLKKDFDKLVSGKDKEAVKGKVEKKVAAKEEAKTEEIEKAMATKYIKKVWRNGRWIYTYPDNGATRNPRQLPDHKVLKNLGGTTGGAMLLELPGGDKKVLKYSTGSAHLKDEYTANRIYEILGVPVPHVQLKEGPKGLGQLADYIEGTPMGELDSETRKKAVESLKAGFVADALLGNWDVLGLAEDNIIWDGNKAWRIDNGGSLRYRAQGQPKGEKFEGSVSEIQSMRDPYKGAGKRAYSTVSDSDVDAQIQRVLDNKQIILNAIDDLALRRVMESRINSLGARVQKSIGDIKIPDMTLLKSDIGDWYLCDHGMMTRFYWFHSLEKATGAKMHYTAADIKGRNMRWVTIRGAKVLLQGTSDGGYVVVGGAGGKLNHLKVDKVLSREDYAEKRKKVEKKRNEDLRELSKEEMAEQVSNRKAEVSAKKIAREEYTNKVTNILGVTQEELRSQISAAEMDAIADKAKAMVEGKVKNKTPEETDAAIEEKTNELVKKAVVEQTKDLEKAALDTLMKDYAPGDPNMKPELRKLLDKDKAIQILTARKEFKKAMKAIGKGQADSHVTLRVGDTYSGDSESIPEDILAEIEQQIETQKNMQLYDRLNAQSDSIQTHVDQGSISALNGLLGDIYGSGATFSTDTIENLGLEAVVRAVTIKLQSDGKGETVRKALEEYSAKEREKVVTKAISESDRRFANADELRNLARDTDDAEAILSMASANGHALKQLTAGQRALGTAVGSLRVVAAMINALEDPPGDVVQVDIGKDLTRARDKAKKAGLPKGSYSIKTLKEGRSKRLVLEIRKDQLDTFFTRNEQLRKDESITAKIKRHEMNNGYLPTGVNPGVKLDAAQEAGLRFFMEKSAVILDFEAGIGKTGMAYAAMMEAMHNKGAKKILVVTPAKTRGDFHKQSNKFLEPEMAKLVHSSTETTSRADRLARHNQDGIHIISQDALREDAAMIKEAGYDMIVVDEIHEMTAGTGQAGRFKSLMDISNIPLKIAMSGTNIKNKKSELYRKINFIDPNHTLGSMSEFNSRYDGLNQGTGMFADAANDAFRKEISEWVYTQKNALPIENTVSTERLALTPEQRKRYAASESQYRMDRDAKKPGASAQRDSRNYAIVTNGNSTQNAKLDKMVDIMKNIHPGEKAVIHLSKPGSPVIHAVKTAVERLEAEFGPGCVGVIQGQGEGSSNAAIAKLKKRFNDPDDPLRFIVGTKSLESGHNLQHGGTVTFHLDIPDSYAAFQQRNARVFRKGQDRDTHAYVLSGTNPFDMRGEDIMETKRKEQEIMGNPRDVDALDETGFLGMLNKYEAEARNEKQSA